MKKVSILLFLLLTVFTGTAQSSFFLQGTVRDEGSDRPIPDHPVFIESPDSLYFNTVITDQNGNYSDVVFFGPMGVLVYTYDCNDMEHQEFLQSPDSMETVNFNICGDSCNIVAGYTYYPDNNHPLTIYFFDMSYDTGEVQWYWNFDDGHTSRQQNPSHTYQTGGFYYVSLTVTDSSGYCQDTYGGLISVDDSANSCIADFTFELDSISNTPYTYYFTDKSKGEINRWEWDFGDGAYSQEQNPTHVYADSGMYQVCLTAGSDDSVHYCEDTWCQWIETPEYYTFGGQVFADNYPINNDENDSSNKAVATLYKNYHNQWYCVDQREFWKFGYYWFVQKVEGNYLVRVDLKEGSSLYNLFAPTYYGDISTWQNSALFTLNTSDYFAVNINLQPLAAIVDGNGNISGKILQKDNCNGFEANHVAIYLYDGSNSLVSITYTDEQGLFSISNLSFGEYLLKAEYSGRYSSSELISIDEQNPTATGISIGITCSKPDGIFQHNSYRGLTIKKSFPIPAYDKLTLIIESDKMRKTDYAIYNISGMRVQRGKLPLVFGNNKVVINVTSLKSGIFLFRIIDEMSRNQVSKKIIIKR